MPSWLSLLINPAHIVRSKLLESILKYRFEISGEVLDFGCGQKPYEEIFEKAWRYIGVDIVYSGHDHSQSKVDVYWDGYTLPFEDESFDNIVAFEVFEHIFNIDEVLNELHRVLRPGGHLLVSTPFMYREHEGPFDSVRYTSWGLSNLLEKRKFKVLEQKKTSGARGVICQLLIDKVGRVFSHFGRLGFLFFIPILTSLNVIGSVSCRAESSNSEDSYLNLVTFAQKI
jgi:SAM-dependent methyltransferase